MTLFGDVVPKSTKALMVATLEVAVPFWVEDLKRVPFARVMERARVCGETIVWKGDVLQFGSKKRGEAAKAFNALAEGLAALSFCEGGVTFLGLHFESTHPEHESDK